MIPEDEAWGRDDVERGGRFEPFYVVRFRQIDLWPNYTGFDVDTLETEVSEHWLRPADTRRVSDQVSQTHDHDHDPHAAIQTSERVSEFEILEKAVRELAIEKGLFSMEDHRRFSEWAESIGPTGGSKLVAKAWTDPDFKERLLADGTEACKEVGIDWLDPTGVGTPSDYTYFYVLENTPDGAQRHRVHAVLVLSAPGARACHPTGTGRRTTVAAWCAGRVKCSPSSACTCRPDVEVRVHDSNQKSRFMVMPMRPEGTEGWTEEQLAAIVTRDTMIGVALPQADWTASGPPSEAKANA